MGDSKVRVLNDGHLSENLSPISAVDLSKLLQKLMLNMKGNFMSEDGRGVDYSALRNSELFERYSNFARDLRQIAVIDLTEDEKKAFFINIYNALTIHGLAETSQTRSIPGSVLEIKDFWKNTAYNIGGYVLSLDDIEHGILRGNRPHPSSTAPLFTKDDPRCKLPVVSVDPRIHFALVCGAKSCPPIGVYSESNLDRALTIAAKNFCSQEVKVADKKVILSKIFAWYKQDFASDDISLLRWLSIYLPDETQSQLEDLIKQMEENGNVEITYSDYNWNLNKLK